MSFLGDAKNRAVRWLFDLWLKANPVSHLAINRATSDGDGMQNPQVNVEAHSKVALVNVYAYAAQKAIAQDVSSTLLNLEKYQTVDGELQWAKVDNHEILDIIKRPNDDEPFEQLLERILLALLGVGDGYLTSDMKIDRELYFTQSKWMKVKVDSDGMLIGYVATNHGQSVTMERDEVIHFKLANANDEYYGVPPSEVIKKTIMMKLALNQYLNQFFDKGAHLGTVLSTDQSLQPEQRSEMRKSFNALHAGGSNAFTVAIMEGGVHVDSPAPLIKDLIPDAIDEMVRSEVLAAYGVPPVKIQSLDGASYANAFKQDQIYQQGTCEPLRRLLESVLTLQWVQVHWGQEYRLKFDRSSVPGLQDDLNEVAKRTDTLYNGQIVTLNEARQLMGYDPVEDGNDFKAIPRRQTIGDDAERSRQPLRQRSVESSEDIIWRKFDSSLTKYEGRYAQIIRKYFDGQVDRLIESLKSFTADGKAMSRLGGIVMKDDSIPRDFSDLFDIEKENDELLLVISKAIDDLLADAGQAVLNDYQIVGTFDVNNPNVQIIADTFKNRVTSINDTTYKNYLKPLMKQSYDEGWSVQELSKEIRSMYSRWVDTELDNYRAMRIARTETIGIVNGGSVESYKQNEIPYKKWFSAPDARTSPYNHQGANRETVEQGAPFIRTGEPLMYPGDPSGSPGNVINCRCAVAPTLTKPKV